MMFRGEDDVIFALLEILDWCVPCFLLVFARSPDAPAANQLNASRIIVLTNVSTGIMYCTQRASQSTECPKTNVA